LQLFYQPELPNGITHLTEDESHHAIKVLRLHKGEEIEITDGVGSFYDTQITDANSKKCAFEIIRSRPIPPRDFHIHIAIAPTKNSDRTEWFVEKSVEIGVDQISFMKCEHSERKAINLERIERVAISAMKQSRQAYLPKLKDITPLENIFRESSAQKFIAFVDSKNPVHLKDLAQPKGRYLLLIGPEGDFTNEELQNALANGFQKVSLGSNRLRTETAGVVGVHCLHLIN
jgi:RNA methyltransferase, RsmE family